MMKSYEAYELMSHPVSNHLVQQKFCKFGIFLWSILMLFYIAYLGIFTTVVLRTQDPQTYYNLTNFMNFDDSYCYNVSKALSTASTNLGGTKQDVDYVLKYVLFILIWLHVAKNLITIIILIQISFIKTRYYWTEIAAVVLSFVFVYDESYQMNLTFRCPIQWQYGAFSQLLSWFCLLHYIQFFPIIGIYVSMLWVIFKKFMKFSAVLIILITAFALSFYMIYRNFDAFATTGLSYIRIGMLK